MFVDNRSLASPDAPDYWPLLAPWIQSRCAVVGPYLEKTTAIHFPISAATGLQGVHYTWAGPVVLEALCLAFPTINFVLTDTDCVPTSLFEVAELVNLLVDKTTRAITMQHHTMASSTNSPPAVLLATEAKAELNAGLVIVTEHKPTQSEDARMEPPSDVEMRPKEQEAAIEEDARAHKSRKIANPRKSPEEWVAELIASRTRFLATTAVPDDPVGAVQGGLLLTPLAGTIAKTPLDWAHAWAILGECRCAKHTTSAGSNCQQGEKAAQLLPNLTCPSETPMARIQTGHAPVHQDVGCTPAGWHQQASGNCPS